MERNSLLNKCASSVGEAPSLRGTAACVACAVVVAFALCLATLAGTCTVGCADPLAEAPAFEAPCYEGEPFVQNDDGTPAFTEEQCASDEPFERYSPLDDLGRCGPAFACVGPETLPTEERGSIGMVKPSGWVTARYDFVDGQYLFNRCHLIAYMLCGENANELNLVTGTRYLNVQGMGPFEQLVYDYVAQTGNHVLYRVTPVFEGDNLVAGGVRMEAWSVEDGGAGVCFDVFVFNVQPGVEIDYATGANQLTDDWEAELAAAGIPYTAASSDEGAPSASAAASPARDSYGAAAQSAPSVAPEDARYVLNTNTHKFHYPDCSSVDDMSEKNKSYFAGTRDEAIAAGYSPCGRCKP